MEIGFETQMDAYCGEIGVERVNEPQSSHHAVILTEVASSRPLSSERVSLLDMCSKTDQKTKEVAWNSEQMSLRKVGGSAEFDAEFKFGGKDGVKVNIGASGTIHDNHGGSGSIKFNRESDGEISTKISVRYDTDRD